MMIPSFFIAGVEDFSFFLSSSFQTNGHLVVA
jgi:hypothetical protein